MLVRAGQLEITYQNGFLRYFCMDKKEVLRMIYFAVRDQDWNTIPGKMLNEQIDQTDDSFHIRYQYEVHQRNIHLLWEVAIQGLPDSTISFAIKGKILRTFLKNRLGFCVLHPIEGLAGKPCLIGHPDGHTTEAYFPAFISPYQPFKNICFMKWAAGPDTSLQMDFEGDLFETEDHRNWTDTSYKTYCTPLDRPFPVEVKAGEEIFQKCTFRVTDASVKSETTVNEHSISIRLTGYTLPFPKIGIGIQAEHEPLQPEETAFLKKAGFSYLRANIFLTQQDWQSSLEKALQQSKILQIPLELAVFLGKHPGNELIEWLALLTPFATSVKQVLVFDAATRLTTNDLLTKVVPAIRLALPAVQIGAGTDANFAELNRNRFDYTPLDFVSYSANPQVHATDELTLLENLAAQADTIQSARKLSFGKPVHISPLTLKPRFNAVATSGEVNSFPPADSRQATDFIAGWALGSIKYVSEGGASAVTYFETKGSRGICSAANVYPVGKVMACILGIHPLKVHASSCTQPLTVSSLVVEAKSGEYLFLANHTAEVQKVLLPQSISMVKVVFSLDTENVNMHPNNTCILASYAVVALHIHLAG